MNGSSTPAPIRHRAGIATPRKVMAAAHRPTSIFAKLGSMLEAVLAVAIFAGLSCVGGTRIQYSKIRKNCVCANVTKLALRVGMALFGTVV